MRKTKPTVYKTLKGLCSQLDHKEITADNMSEKRAKFKDGWFYNFKISDEAEHEFWSGLANVVWKNPKSWQIERLKYVKTWMLQRLTWHPRYGFSYIAGQDYPYEIRAIQNCVNRM